MPEFDLSDVKKILIENKKVWIARESAKEMYRQVMGYFARDMKRVEREIVEGLMLLQEGHFCKSVPIPNLKTGVKEWYDVYGLLAYNGWDWYVKFRILSDGRLYDISFHLPDDDLTLRDGTVCLSGPNQHRRKENR